MFHLMPKSYAATRSRRRARCPGATPNSWWSASPDEAARSRQANGCSQVTPATIGPGGRATVTVDVTNTGTRAGDEVVQLYVHDMVSSVTRPVKELAGFERVTLRPGEKKTVTFALGPEALSLVDRRMQRVVEPGTFEVLIGTSSNTTLRATLEVAAR